MYTAKHSVDSTHTLCTDIMSCHFQIQLPVPGLWVVGGLAEKVETDETTPIYVFLLAINFVSA